MILSPYLRFVLKSVRHVATAIVAMGFLGIASILLSWISGTPWVYPWYSVLLLIFGIVVGIFVRRITAEVLAQAAS